MIDQSSNPKPSEYDDGGPGWKLRLFIRALLAQNLKYLLKRTGHTQSDLQLYTGLAKLTVNTACNVKPDFSNLNKSAFKSNTFVFALCFHIDYFIYDLRPNDAERDIIVFELLDRSSDKYAALSDFLIGEGLTQDQIDKYAEQLCPPLQFGTDSFHSLWFTTLWNLSFVNYKVKFDLELKGKRFKDSILGTCGADSFNFTTVRNVYFDLVFLQQSDLGSDVFMYPLLRCMMIRGVNCLFDIQQLKNLKLQITDHWDETLDELISYRDALSNSNIDSTNVHKEVNSDIVNMIECSKQQVVFILLLSKLMRNLAILRGLKLVASRDEVHSSPTDLLLSQKFACKDYPIQAIQLIDDIILGLDKISKRRNINLDSALSFLNSLDKTKSNPYYIFTAAVGKYLPFQNIKLDPKYNITLRYDHDNASRNKNLFCTAKENKLVQTKDLHVLQYNMSTSFYSQNGLLISYPEATLCLVKSVNKSGPDNNNNLLNVDGLCYISLFYGYLNTYFLNPYLKGVYEVDKRLGGAQLFSELKVDNDKPGDDKDNPGNDVNNKPGDDNNSGNDDNDKSSGDDKNNNHGIILHEFLDKFLDKLPVAYFGHVLPKYEHEPSKWLKDKMAKVLKEFLQRGGVES